MDIASLWIKRKGYEDVAPELLVAWDEYSIEENWDGWASACHDALKACGDEVLDKRFINLSVQQSQIEAIFMRGTIPVVNVTELDDPSAI